MLIKFNPSLMTFKKVKFKRITTALGGYVSVLDEDNFAKTGKESFHKFDCPVAVGRSFTAKHGNGHFLRPTEGCITFYDGRVVALEIAPFAQQNERMTQGLFGIREWISQSETNFTTVRRPDMDEGHWYFDGVYIYTFMQHDLNKVIADADVMSNDGNFRDVRCNALNLTHISAGSDSMSKKQKQKSAESALVIEERSCLGFIIGDKFVISPPIWKELQGMSDRKTKGKDIDESEDGIFDTAVSLSTMDEKLFVNLQFALAAGKEISQAFGYNAIAPLQFPRLMIELKTVNLPNIPKEVKTTHGIGMSFTHGLAWLLGLLYRAEKVEQLNAVRRMLKYLTTKGVYRKSVVAESGIKCAEAPAELPPMLSFDEALMNLETMPTNEFKKALDILTGSARAKSGIDVLSLDSMDMVPV